MKGELSQIWARERVDFGDEIRFLSDLRMHIRNFEVECKRSNIRCADWTDTALNSALGSEYARLRVEAREQEKNLTQDLCWVLMTIFLEELEEEAPNEETLAYIRGRLAALDVRRVCRPLEGRSARDRE